MPRQKHERKSHRFELDLEEPDEKALHEYLVRLGAHGKASAWIIRSCEEAWYRESSSSTPPWHPTQKDVEDSIERMLAVRKSLK